MGYHTVRTPDFFCDTFQGPRQCGTQGLTQDRSAGFADGRQLLVRPLIRMALPQLLHQKTVRQYHEVHVPGLALAVAQLTVPHAQLLLAIPMKGFRACPTMPIHTHHTRYFPLDSVRHQNNLVCSPKTGLGGMRVSEAPWGQETNHEATHA